MRNEKLSTVTLALAGRSTDFSRCVPCCQQASEKAEKTEKTEARLTMRNAVVVTRYALPVMRSHACTDHTKLCSAMSTPSHSPQVRPGSDFICTTRWSSSGHDKSIHDSEFAGRLDFNQCTEGEYTRSEALLEVQSALRQ